MTSVLRRLLGTGWTLANCKGPPATKADSRRPRPSCGEQLCSSFPCVERTFDFMGMIIFILAHSRMKPKKQDIVLFRDNTMDHLQAQTTGKFSLCFVGGSWKPALYNLLKKKAHERRRHELKHCGRTGGQRDTLNSKSASVYSFFSPTSIIHLMRRK